MLTSKQRATLRGIASTYETIFQVGKGGISDTLVQQVSDALRTYWTTALWMPERRRRSWRKRQSQRWYRSSAIVSSCSSAIPKSRW